MSYFASHGRLFCFPLAMIGTFAAPPESDEETLKAAGFYAEWRGKFGEDAWKVLERYSGALS